MTTEELARIFKTYVNEAHEVQQEAAKTYTDGFTTLYWLTLFIAKEAGISEDRFMELLDQAVLQSRSKRVEINEKNDREGFDQ